MTQEDATKLNKEQEREEYAKLYHEEQLTKNSKQ